SSASGWAIPSRLPPGITCNSPKSTSSGPRRAAHIRAHFRRKMRHSHRRAGMVHDTPKRKKTRKQRSLFNRCSPLMSLSNHNYYASYFRPLIDYMATYLRFVRNSDALDAGQVPTPIFLGGISWGGKLVMALQRRHPGLADGLMLLCPGLVPRVTPSFLQRLGII